MSYSYDESIILFDNIVSIAGILANIITLYFIYAKTGARLMVYRNLMLQSCIHNFLFAVATFVTKTHVDLKNGSFFMLMRGTFSNIESPYNLILIACWNFILIFYISSLPIKYVYRYFVIIKDAKPSKWYYILLLWISFCLTVIYFCLNLYVLWPNRFVVRTKTQLLRDDEFYDKVPNFVVAEIEGDDPGAIPKLKIMFGYCCFLLVSSYAISIGVNFAVYKYLQTKKHLMSAFAKEFHKEISMFFIIEALIPFIFCFLPLSSFVICTYLQTTLPKYALLGVMIVELIPFINAITKLFALSDYRLTLFEYFQWRPLTTTKSKVTVLPISGKMARHRLSVIS